jgi:hypothetical protein
MTVSIGRRTAPGVVGLAAAAALAWVVPVLAAPAAKAANVEQTPRGGQDHQNGPRIARDWAAAWNSSDTTLLAKLFTKDGVYVDPCLRRPVAGLDLRPEGPSRPRQRPGGGDGRRTGHCRRTPADACGAQPGTALNELGQRMKEPDAVFTNAR